MPRHTENLKGREFGKLTVDRFHAIETNSLGTRRTMWWVRCSCGSPEKKVRASSLLNGNTKSCGCLRIENSCRQLGIQHQPIRNQVYWQYKYQATKRGLEWSLLDEEFKTLTSANCHYCGKPPMNCKGGITYNGIDRKDNSRGYVTENVVPCCKICNRMKNTMSYEDFIAFILRAAKHLTSQFPRSPISSNGNTLGATFSASQRR